MPWSLHRVTLLAFGRALVLLAFYREIYMFISTALASLSRGFSAMLIAVHNPSFLASFATSLLALATLATGNTLLFAIAVILSAFTCVKPCLPLTQLLLFMAYLMLDTVVTGYRGLEHTSVRARLKDVAKSVPIPLAVVAVSTAIATGVTLVVTTIIGSFTRVPQSNPQLYAIMTSPITKIVVSLAALLYAYKVAKAAGEITAIAIAPTSSVALSELLNEDEIDSIFTPVFRWPLYMALALVLYSPIYTMVFNVLLHNVLNNLSDLMRMGVSAVAYALLIFLCRSFDILSELYGGEKKLAVASLAMLALAYASAVKLAFPYHGWGALLAPDFQGLAEAIQKSYVDFGNTVITLINTLFRLVGAAP